MARRHTPYYHQFVALGAEIVDRIGEIIFQTGGLNNKFFESPGSDHPGGANFGMTDGSVQFLSTSIDPNAPGAGQHDAPLKSRSSISNFLEVFTADASMPGYRLGAMQPKKKLYSFIDFPPPSPL